MSFYKWTADLFEYRRTRFPVARFLALAVFLAFASSAAEDRPSIETSAVRVFVVVLWLFQFRLGDDLADRDRDRRDHPDRVLARTDPRPFVWLLAILSAANGLLTGSLLSVSRGAEFLALGCGFVLWYRLMRGRPDPLLTSAGVLLKYPAFVYLIGDPSGGATRSESIGVLVVVYACFLTHEILHEKRLLSKPGMSGYLALAMMLLAAAAARFMVAHEPDGREWQMVGSLGIGCVVMAWLFRRHWLRREPGPWPEVIFLVAGLWLAAGCHW